MPTIRIADFSIFPGGRYIRDGLHSGEEFRNKVLAPALLDAIKKDEVLIVDLDGTRGYGSSFLEEAFGGLIRMGIVTRSNVLAHMSVATRSRIFEPYRALAVRYIDAARPEMAVA